MPESERLEDSVIFHYRSYAVREDSRLIGSFGIREHGKLPRFLRPTVYVMFTAGQNGIRFDKTSYQAQCENRENYYEEFEPNETQRIALDAVLEAIKQRWSHPSETGEPPIKDTYQPNKDPMNFQSAHPDMHAYFKNGTAVYRATIKPHKKQSVRFYPTRYGFRSPRVLGESPGVRTASTGIRHRGRAGRESRY